MSLSIVPAGTHTVRLTNAQRELLKRLPPDLKDVLAAGTAPVFAQDISTRGATSPMAEIDPRDIADALQTFLAPCDNALPARTRRGV